MLALAAKRNKILGESIEVSSQLTRHVAAWILASGATNDPSIALTETIRLNRKARASGIVSQEGTGCRTWYRCNVCGWIGGHHSAKWPRTVRSLAETDAHIGEELQKVENLSGLYKGDYGASCLYVRENK